MKRKRFSKKLVFNKTTVSDLDKLEFNRVRGGTYLTPIISAIPGMHCYPYPDYEPMTDQTNDPNQICAACS